MKTLTVSLKGISRLAFLSILLFIASCKNKEGNAQRTQTKVSAPQIDLHTAVLTENLDAVKQHIAAGSDLNVKDPFGGSSPLITASLFGKTGMAKVLIDAGADLNFQNKDGSTPLHVAAFFCRPEIVKMLLEKKADKTIRNNFKSTAYESVTPPFKDVKGVYDMMSTALAPMGLKLDYAYLEKTRPEIAAMLK